MISSRAANPIPPTAQLRLNLLGGVQLLWEGQALKLSAPRLLGIVAYLHLHGPTSREDLMDVFWSGRSSQHLRQALYLLRALPGSQGWLHDQAGDDLSLNASSDVAQVRELLHQEDYAPALEILGGGTLLGHLPEVSPVFSDWLEEERERLAQERLRGLRTYGELLTQRRDFTQGRAHLRQAIELDPLDEATYRCLMHLENVSGHLPQALSVFEQCRQTLHRELGAAPERATLQLLRQMESAQAGPAQAGSARALCLGAAQLRARTTDPLCGREDELQSLSALLNEKKRVLLYGLGGMGKTRLAWAAAQEAARTGGQVLWLELGQDALQDALPALLTALEERVQPDLKASQAALAQALSRQDIKLLVLDNAQSSYALASLLELLPPNLPVLVTARQRLPRLPRLEVGRLSRAAALLLVREHLPDGALVSAAALDALCAVLGDHPYALRLAAKTLGQSSLEPQELLQALLKHGLPGEDGPSQPSVRELIEQSVSLLNTDSYEAYLGMGSLPSPQATPELLSLALRRPLATVEEALYTLVEHGLVSRETRPGSEQVAFRMHELTWAEASAHRLLLWPSVLHAVCAFAEGHQAAPELLATELSNLIRAGQLARDKGQYAALTRLMSGWLGGQYIAARGYPTGQLELLQDAMRCAEQRQDWASASLLGGKLGDIWHALLGHHQAAIASYLSAAEQAGRAGLLQRQATQLALAGVLLAMNHLPQAQATLKRAWEVAGRSGDVLCQSKVLEQRGIASALERDFLLARDLLTQARALLSPHLLNAPAEQSRPDQKALHAAYISVTSNLGQAEQRLGNLEAALALKQEALGLAQQGDEQLLVARAQADVGELCALLGQRDAAIEALKAALDIYREIGASAQEEAVRRVLNAIYTAPPEADSPEGEA